MVESSRIPSFLLSALAVQVLAQFDMSNHPHRLPDSSTLPARLIHWASRDERVGGGGDRGEGNRDVKRKKMEAGGETDGACQEFMICATTPSNANVTRSCNICDNTHFFQVAFVILALHDF